MQLYPSMRVHLKPPLENPHASDFSLAKGRSLVFTPKLFAKSSSATSREWGTFR